MACAVIRPSRLLAAAFALAHTAAAATVFPLEMPFEWKAALLAAVLASLVRCVGRHARLRGRRAIVELEIKDRETATITLRSGERLDARILGTSCVTPMLTTINLKAQGHRIAKHVLLVADSVAPEDFRKVRVLLRWARPESPGSRQGPDSPAARAG